MSSDPYKLAYRKIKDVRIYFQVKSRDILHDIKKIQKDYRDKGLSEDELSRDRPYNQYLGKLVMIIYISQELGIGVHPDLIPFVKHIGGEIHH